jgi:uncharacterized protein YndB with AHSA1/START domain
VIEPLRLSLVVACPADHAFATWTARATAWWPPDHTVSTETNLDVVFEPRVGGRIFERTASGIEIEWGEITAWEPPRRIAYLWHIATDRSDATDVEIVFSQLADLTTRVDIEHRGWERLGAKGRPWRDANRAGWDGVLPAYMAACAGAADITRGLS